VKSADLRPLFERAKKMAQTFESFRIEHVYREQNAEADALANEAMDEAEGRTRPPVAAPKNEKGAVNSTPQKLRAVYRDGALHLKDALNLPENTDVEILVRPSLKQ